jgi:hypothetical protein
MGILKRKNDILRGTLALLVLKTLEQRPMHVWGITLHIQQTANDVLRAEEGVSVSRDSPDGAGWLDHREVEESWQRLRAAIACVLSFATDRA